MSYRNQEIPSFPRKREAMAEGCERSALDPRFRGGDDELLIPFGDGR